MDVVVTKISGPTIASILLTTKAFSILFNFNIMIAANISNVPDNKRKKDIPKIALSKI
jgi:hypothetical protein